MSRNKSREDYEVGETIRQTIGDLTGIPADLRAAFESRGISAEQARAGFERLRQHGVEVGVPWDDAEIASHILDRFENEVLVPELSDEHQPRRIVEGAAESAAASHAADKALSPERYDYSPGESALTSDDRGIDSAIRSAIRAEGSSNASVG